MKTILFAVYEPTDDANIGRIVSVGHCVDTAYPDVQKNLQPGQTMVEIPTGWSVTDPNGFYMNLTTNLPEARPFGSLPTHRTVKVGDTLSFPLPKGASFAMCGATKTMPDASGNIIVDTSAPGVIIVSVDPYPEKASVMIVEIQAAGN